MTAKTMAMLALTGFLGLTAGATDYTWTGGGENTNWGNPANWGQTEMTAYPQTTGDTAKFLRGSAIVVTIDNNYSVGTVDLTDFNPDDTTDNIQLTFRGKDGEDYGTNKMLTVSTLSINAADGYLKLDRAALKVSNNITLGARRTLELANGSYLYLANVYSRSGGTFYIGDNSYATFQLMFQDGSDSTLVVDNATLYVRERLEHCEANVTTDGGKVRFRGARPIMRFASGAYINHRANGAYTLTYTFEVPVGGYAEAPIQSVNGTCDFPQYYGANFLKFDIDPESPCYTQVVTFDTPLVSWPGSKQVLSNGKNTFGTLPDGGCFYYGTSATDPYGWTNVSGFSGTAKSIGAHIVSVAHNDLMSVSDDVDNAVTECSPSYEVTSQTEAAKDGVIVFSAPTTSETDGVRYVCKGYTLTEIVKSGSGSVTNVTTKAENLFNYALANKEIHVVWHFAKDYKVTAAAVNDANATVTLTKGTGYVSETVSVTLEASTTSEDMEFQYWYGDVPYASRYENPITLTGTKGLSVNAFFGKKKANAVTALAEAGDTSTVKSWFDAAVWGGKIVPGTNDTAIVRWTGRNCGHANRFALEAASFFAVKDLIISNAMVRVNANQRDNTAGGISLSNDRHSEAPDQTREEPVGCDIYGDLVIDCYQLDSSSYFGWSRSINGGWFCVGGTYQRAGSQVVVMGDLTIADGIIVIHAGYPFNLNWIDASKAVDGPTGVLPFNHTDEFFRGRNFLRVLGKTTLKTPARSDYSNWPAYNVIQPVNDYRTGVAVWFDLKDLEIQPRGGFTSFGGGYAKFGADGKTQSNWYCMCPGGHGKGDNTSGGSYGGFGGSEKVNPSVQTPTTHVATYGFANAPYYPGSQDGGMSGVYNLSAAGIQGSGTIRIDCGNLVLDGSLVANGLSAIGNKGASSGGGIWVVCDTFKPGSDCAVQAQGGPSTGSNAGGGGGRVSICEGLTDEQVEAIYSSEDHTATDIKVSSLADKLGSRFSAAGGTGTSDRSNGFDGTGVYIVNTAGKKTMTVAGDPENFGVPTPAYGPHVYENNTIVTLSGPDDAYITDDEGSKRLCVGYTITDVDGEVLVDSDKRTGSFKMTTDCTLTWKLTSVVHKIAAGVTVGGTIVTNAISAADDAWQPEGSTITLTATPDSGSAFIGWIGLLPTNLQHNATLTYAADRGRSFKAMFATTASGDISWTGAGDGASWEDAANWEGGAIPGANCRVTIPNGANVKANFCVPVAVKSLMVEKGASLTFGPNGTYSTYATPRIAENADETDWQRISLIVAENLTVNGTFNIGGKFSLSKFDLTVGGSLAFGNGANGNFYAAYNAPLEFLENPKSRYTTNQTDMVRAAAYATSGRVTVGDAFLIATNAVVAPWCDFYSGASVRFDVGAFCLEQGGKIDADGKGWGYNIYNDIVYTLCPTLNDGLTWGYGGGTYGGIGGYSDTHYPSYMIYGWTLAPMLPGGPGFNGPRSPGGGVVRIHANGSLRCYGTITAIGASLDSGAGAGGGVFLSGARLRTTTSTLITAEGCLRVGNGGAGGGGRVMIGLRLSDDDIAQLGTSGTCERLSTDKVTITDLMVGMPASLKGEITAMGGHNGRTNVVNRHYSGEDGTAILLEGPKPGLLMIVK